MLLIELKSAKISLLLRDLPSFFPFFLIFLSVQKKNNCTNQDMEKIDFFFSELCFCLLLNCCNKAIEKIRSKNQLSDYLCLSRNLLKSNF